MAKQLTVYHRDSYFRFRNMFEERWHEIDDTGILRITYAPGHTEIETLEAAFKNWDYFQIDEQE